MNNFLYVILDTNSILKSPETDYLVNICNLLKSVEGMKILIPYIIIQELDGLKNSPRSSIASKAQKSILALQKILTDGTNCLEIQQRNQIFQGSAGDLNDDQILDCCLYWLEHVSKFCILVTNDRNLSVKAMAHSVRTIDPIDDYQTSKGLFDYLCSLSPSNFGKKSIKNPDEDMIIDDPFPNSQDSTDHSMIIDMPLILRQIYTIVLDAFVNAIQERLGNNQAKYPRPWNLEIIFTILEKEYDKGISAKDYPPYWRKSELSPIMMLAKDCDRSVRQNLCTLTIGDIKSFQNRIRAYFFICSPVVRKKVLSQIDEIIKFLNG